MRPGFRGKTMTLALVALGVAIVASGMTGCTQADVPQAERRPIPPIDLEVPERLETTTFAMG